MICAFPRIEMALLMCDSSGCAGNLPFPFDWQPNSSSIRTFSSACGWVNRGLLDYCLECVEAMGTPAYAVS